MAAAYEPYTNRARSLQLAHTYRTYNQHHCIIAFLYICTTSTHLTWIFPHHPSLLDCVRRCDCDLRSKDLATCLKRLLGPRLLTACCCCWLRAAAAVSVLALVRPAE